MNKKLILVSIILLVLFFVILTMGSFIVNQHGKQPFRNTAITKSAPKLPSANIQKPKPEEKTKPIQEEEIEIVPPGKRSDVLTY